MSGDIKKIREALIHYSHCETKAISKTIECSEALSDKFYSELDERFKEIKKEIFDEPKTISLPKITKLLIAATLIIVCLCIVACVAIRTRVGGLLIEWLEDRLELSIDEPPEEIASIENVKIEYIPAEFAESEVKSGLDWKSYEWKNGDSSIYLQFSVIRNGNMSLNTENSEYKVHVIGDYTVHSTEYGEEFFALWYDGKIIYKLNGLKLEWEEMVKIIEGISYIEE